MKSRGHRPFPSGFAKWLQVQIEKGPCPMSWGAVPPAKGTVSPSGNPLHRQSASACHLLSQAHQHLKCADHLPVLPRPVLRHGLKEPLAEIPRAPEGPLPPREGTPRLVKISAWLGVPALRSLFSHPLSKGTKERHVIFFVCAVPVYAADTLAQRTEGLRIALDERAQGLECGLEFCCKFRFTH